jgi:hypothetical protein
MQPKFWKLYTPSILRPEISCISQPTYYTSTRFGVPFGPFFHKTRPQSVAAKIESSKEYRKTKTADNDRMDVDQIIQRQIKSRIIPTTVTAEFDKTITASSSQFIDASLATNLGQMMIPIQPRKNLANISSANNSNSLQSNLSEFTGANNRPATTNPQSHSQSRIINELYTTNRYNLRSATPTKPEKSDLKILGLSVTSSDNSNYEKNAFNTSQ